MAVSDVNFDACVTSLRFQATKSSSRPKKSAPPPTPVEKARRRQLSEKYKYGDGLTRKELSSIPDKKLKAKIRQIDAKAQSANAKAVLADLMLTERTGFIKAEGAEKSFRLRQADLRDQIDAQNADKIFNLSLDLGPYSLDYSRNGSHLILGGRKGHISMFEWGSFQLESEIFVKETIRDVKYLHNHTMAAVAQKKYVYIYDNNGVELHCLRNHVEPTRLDFLPYHFLLVSIGKAGVLKYQDTSTGAIVAQHRTKKGETRVMTHNPQNGVVHVGHSQGVVSLWTPNLPTAAATVLCHKGSVQALKVANDGYTMVTSGAEGRVAIWDLRNYKLVHELPTFAPASTIDISQTGLMALGINGRVQIYKDRSLYMTHMIQGSQMNEVRFCPFQDVCGLGHSNGLSSIVVPGAAEANFDAFEANPFETKSQRREAEVKQLLDKIQPDMITLQRNAIGSVRRSNESAIVEKDDDDPKDGGVNLKRKARGRSTTAKNFQKRKDIKERRKQTEIRNAVRSIEIAENKKSKDVQFKNALDRFK